MYIGTLLQEYYTDDRRKSLLIIKLNTSKTPSSHLNLKHKKQLIHENRRLIKVYKKPAFFQVLQLTDRLRGHLCPVDILLNLFQSGKQKGVNQNFTNFSFQFISLRKVCHYNVLTMNKVPSHMRCSFINLDLIKTLNSLF